MNVESLDHKLLGLFELSEDGKILYSSLEAVEGELTRHSELDGFDFFADVACFANVEDFERRFEVFRLTEDRSRSFQFTCHYADGSYDIRVVMARLMPRSGPDSFLVHLKRPGSGLARDNP